MKWPYLFSATQSIRDFYTQLKGLFSDVGSDMQEQKSRVDNLITNAPQPSEVVDIRTDENGVVHPTARDRIIADKADLQANIDQNKTDQGVVNDSVAAQLADEVQQRKNNDVLKADLNYVNQLLSTISSGSPKGLFYAISALNTAYPTGSEGPMLVFDSSFTDGAHAMMWNGSMWADLGVYEASIPGDGTVNETSFSTDLSEKLSGFEQLDYAIETGIYRFDNAQLDSSFVNYNCLKASVKPGDLLRANCMTNGSGTAMALFYDDQGNYSGSLNQGIDGANTGYIDYQFSVPPGIYAVAITSLIGFALKLEKSSVVHAAQRLDTLEGSQTSYRKMNYTIVNGFYDPTTGNLRTDIDGYHTLKVTANPGDKMQATALVSGIGTALILFLKSDQSVLTFLEGGINGQNTQYTNYKFNVPAAAAFVCVTGLSVSPIELDKFALLPTANILNDHDSRIGELESLTNYWSGKKIVWFGTSIPAGTPTNNYPSKIGALLGADVVNEAIGYSSARIGEHSIITQSDPMGWTGVPWQNIAYSLSMSKAEKQQLIDNWSTWQPLLGNNPPTTLDVSTQSYILATSYEQRLMPHLGDGKRADLYVFDHGHNDNLLWDIAKDELTTIPADPIDRTYFIGAINYLIQLILSDNPRARIVFIGHYEDARKIQISQAQTVLADLWDYPFLPLWSKLGWTQQTVTTKGYWTNGIWTAEGGQSQNLTMTQVWLADDLHPHTDLSGQATDLIADTIANWLKDVR